MIVRSVIFDLSRGEAIVGPITVPVAPVGAYGMLQVDGPGGPVLRPISFSERTEAIYRAISSPSPREEVARAILALATVLPGATESVVHQIIALALAGAGIDAPPIKTTEMLIGQSEWGPKEIAEVAAATVDRMAIQPKASPRAEPPSLPNTWRRIVLVRGVEDELLELRDELAGCLLGCLSGSDHDSVEVDDGLRRGTVAGVDAPPEAAPCFRLSIDPVRGNAEKATESADEDPDRLPERPSERNQSEPNQNGGEALPWLRRTARVTREEAGHQSVWAAGIPGLSAPERARPDPVDRAGAPIPKAAVSNADSAISNHQRQRRLERAPAARWQIHQDAVGYKRFAAQSDVVQLLAAGQHSKVSGDGFRAGIDSIGTESPRSNASAVAAQDCEPPLSGSWTLAGASTSSLSAYAGAALVPASDALASKLDDYELADRLAALLDEEADLRGIEP